MDFCLPEFAVTTPFLLFLLARWGGTLGDAQRENARKLLHGVVWLLPEGTVHWHLQEEGVDLSSVLPASTTAAAVPLPVVNRKVLVLPLLRASAVIARAVRLRCMCIL